MRTMSWRAWVITVWTGIVSSSRPLLWAEPLLDGSSPSAATGRSAIDLLIAAISGSKPGTCGCGSCRSVSPDCYQSSHFQRPRRHRNRPSRRKTGRTGGSAARNEPLRWTRHWLEIVAMVLVGLAIASTSVNGTWRLSREWILQLAAGCVGRSFLSRFAHDRCVNRILFVGAMIAALRDTSCLLCIGMSIMWSSLPGPSGRSRSTAGMAAIWAAVALATAILRSPRAHVQTPHRVVSFLTIVVIVAALSLLFVAARRAAWLAVLVAGAYSAILVILRYDKSRRARRMVPTSVVVFVARSPPAYFYFQSRSSNPSASIPIAYRLIYWKNTVAAPVR